MALVQGFYTRGAFFRNEHLVAEMMDQLDVILPLQFSLTMHFADLDKVLFVIREDVEVTL